MNQASPWVPMGLHQPQPRRHPAKAAPIASQRGAEACQLEFLRTDLVDKAGPGEEAEKAIERRGVCPGLRSQFIATLGSAGQQIGNSGLRDDVDGLRDAIAADEFEDFAKVLRRRSVRRSADNCAHETSLAPANSVAS